MRVLIIVDDADRDCVLATKDTDGVFLFGSTAGRMCKAAVVGELDPHAYSMQEGNGKAIYDVTLLESMK